MYIHADQEIMEKTKSSSMPSGTILKAPSEDNQRFM
jgi:hypothetical protein